MDDLADLSRDQLLEEMKRAEAESENEDLKHAMREVFTYSVDRPPGRRADEPSSMGAAVNPLIFPFLTYVIVS